MPPALQLHLPLPTPQPGAEGADSLPDRLCALIARRGRPLEVGHVATQLLRLRRCPERLQRRLVAEIVEGDARLAWLGRDLVGLAPPEWSSAGLAGATFCVVDLETTGGSPGFSKVTEIGAVRVRGGELVERFVTLVNPNRPIPQVVTELTGIDDEMVAGSPDIEDALARFVEFAGQDVLVAHNAPFVLRFLNYERRRLASRYFTQPWLDTLVLARRLLDGQVERHDLRTLAGWADTSVEPIHRALPDAEATAEVLMVLLELLAERGVDTLERAVAFGGTGGARHAYKLALAEELPALPGVYVMRDRRRRALYVGKAADLRRRVRSYFGPGGRHGRLIGRALEQLDSIDHEVCGSDFAALLRENDLIKQLNPPCNRRGAGAGGRFVKISWGEMAPRLYVVSRVLADGASYFGPIRSERLAREAVERLHAMYPLAAQDPEARDEALAEVEKLLGGDAAAIGRLGPRIAQAVVDGRLDFDPSEADGPAESVLGLLGALARVRRAQRRAAVIVEPRRDGGAEAFFVAGGIVRSRADIVPHDWRDAARVGLDALRRAARRPAALAPDALDEVTIVEGRLLDGAATGSALRLPEGWRTAVALAWIEGAVARVCSTSAAPGG
ncbi:MAG TPA: exonuclease domain-containing protein [Miltoncostaeaceae bacterium]|nr:exonuclease domain-containing protein [Miltoncostaeaceae bacterium]